MTASLRATTIYALSITSILVGCAHRPALTAMTAPAPTAVKAERSVEPAAATAPRVEERFVARQEEIIVARLTDPKQKNFTVWYFVAAAVALMLVQALVLAPHVENLSYSEFKSLVAKGKVTNLVIAKQVISGTLAADGLEGLLPKEKLDELKRYGNGVHQFVTARVDDPALVADLEAAHVRFTGTVENTWLTALLGWVVPALVFVGLWAFLMRRMGNAQGGLLAIGKGRAKVDVETSRGVTFDDVAGIDEARGELIEIVDFLERPERYRRLGGKIPKGVLLVGAPGTGKKLLATAVGGEARGPFVCLTACDFIEMFVGVGAARVRDLFEQAQAKAP